MSDILRASYEASPCFLFPRYLFFDILATELGWAGLVRRVFIKFSSHVLKYKAFTASLALQMLGAGIDRPNLSARGSPACSLSLFLIWHGHQGCSYGLFFFNSLSAT